MATTIKFKRGTRINLNSLASSNSLEAGEPILITDEDRIAICTSDSTYEEFAKTYEALNKSAGCVVMPTITDNGNGSITVSNNGEYNLYSNSQGDGAITTYSINGNTFTLTDNTTNYLVASYNSGTPTLSIITNASLLTHTDVIPIETIYRNGIYLHKQDWNSVGLALANKLHQSIIRTQRYRRESGLALTESGTRNLNLTAGIVWTGGVVNSLDAIATATDNLFLCYKNSGTWTTSVVSQYNNTQYQNGDNLATLTTARYAVNFVYRGVEQQKHLYIVLGTGDYTEAQAVSATVPEIPLLISSHAVLVAKIIVQKSSNTAYSISSAFDPQFMGEAAGGGTSDHTQLTNLAWASSAHTGTANKLAGFGTSGEAVYVDPPTGGGASLWTAIVGTRASNTTITVTGDQTALFKKGMIVRWKESTVDKWGMVSIPSTYSSVTTITIVGCVCASIDSGSFQYSSLIGVEQFKQRFVTAGTLGAISTNVMNSWVALEPYNVIGVDVYVGVAGTTGSTTFDLNKNGTTMFTTKPTLSSTVSYSSTPFSADSGTTLALGDRVTVDIDAINTTPAIDAYLELYVIPARYFTLG